LKGKYEVRLDISIPESEDGDNAGEDSFFLRELGIKIIRVEPQEIRILKNPRILRENGIP
jgi:hypothetical protein